MRAKERLRAETRSYYRTELYKHCVLYFRTFAFCFTLLKQVINLFLQNIFMFLVSRPTLSCQGLDLLLAKSCHTLFNALLLEYSTTVIYFSVAFFYCPTIYYYNSNLCYLHPTIYVYSFFTILLAY